MIDSVMPPSPTPQSAPGSSTYMNPGGQMGQEEFLKLFIAQVRHQDPLNPLEAQEMAAQLAQFSSVEQLINLNQKIDGQAQTDAAVLQALHSNSAMGTLGRTVLAVGNEVTISESGDAQVSAAVGGAGGTATLRIFDAAGNEVGSRFLGGVPAGRGTWEVGRAAEGLAPGRYTFAVEVTDGNGEPVSAETLISARVDGIRFGPEGPVLTSGGMVIPIGQVVEVLSEE